MRVWPMLTLSLLTTCGSDDSMTRQFGLSRDAAPDTVAATQLPLSMPPSLTMRPTRSAILPADSNGTAPQANVSPGQDALLSAAGPAAPSDIRQLVDANSGLVSAGPAFAQSVLNWTPPPGYTPMPAISKKGWFSRIF